ncbi:PREDICTED: uncharacterized protein LOC108566262 [Nicrophorus vespilloides]|uniref:Uncharacterized protein LOC108566262 n=1 Tax=Nicrophorus vespilloides TaxID=110193 RepID=A0ABM1N400_NICVS|nr:PREDICTED: uncharacterized protein LOC108566262 [Nicrophorus vespilloides]
MEQDLYVFGGNFSEIRYKNFLDWFVRISDIKLHWKHEPSYLIAQFAFIFGAAVTAIHAFSKCNRFRYLWIGTLLHGLVVESMSYLVPDIDNFWHSQTHVVFFGHRLPLHIIFLYPCFIYQASVAVAKLKLPRWAEPFAVGLCTVLIDIPYDIISVNFLHWTWHDTDPNIEDRMFWVPWNSYYFHACFAASFTFWFHFIPKTICKSKDKWDCHSFSNEMLSTAFASVLGTPFGILLFIPIYHPLHDIYGVHSSITFSIILLIFLVVIGFGCKNIARNVTNFARVDYLLVTHLVLHYLTFLVIPIFFDPKKEISVGLKEPIGPCDEVVSVKTAFGMMLQKKKYLCARDFHEGYFNWDCLSEVPADGSIWYTACGAALKNPLGMMFTVVLMEILALIVFRFLHFHSVEQRSSNSQKNKRR